MVSLRDRFRRNRGEEPEEYYEPEYYPEEVPPAGYYQEPQYQEQIPEGYQQYQQQTEPEQAYLPPKIQGSSDNASPLSILDEIKNKRLPKGTAPVIIQGVPVDLHILEDYIISISPYNIKTLMRYNNARILEEIKGYSKFGIGMKVNSKAIILILLAVGMAVLGIIFIMFMPQIMQMLQGGI